MRKFEKISALEFEKDILDGKYEDLVLPRRSTRNSAGYDFISVIDINLKPGERKIIPTVLKLLWMRMSF